MASANRSANNSAVFRQRPTVSELSLLGQKTGAIFCAARSIGEDFLRHSMSVAASLTPARTARHFAGFAVNPSCLARISASSTASA